MRCRDFALVVGLLASLLGALTARAQTPISRYNFNGDLTNASTFKDVNMVEAPDGTFREGANSATAPVGTPTFARGVDGTLGGALSLDGADDWVDVTTAGHPSSTVPSGSFSGPGIVSGTAMAWVRVQPSILDGERWLMGSTNAAPSFQSWQMGWDDEALLARPAAAGNDSQQYVIRDATDNTTWANGAWHHLAFAWDGLLSEAEVYVDGVPLGIEPSTPNLFGAPQAAWQFQMAIGARNAGGALAGFWPGLVDDLRIYAEMLTDAQVLAIKNATVVAPDPSPTSGDFDGDGDSDGADFLTWQRNVGSGDDFAEGDADDDNDVDGSDLNFWKSGFAAMPASPTTTAVPEPSALALLTIAGFALATWRRRYTA